MTRTAGSAANYWPGSRFQWKRGGAAITDNGTISGHPAYRIETLAGGAGKVYIEVAAVPTGKAATLTTYLLATPNTHTDISIFGSSEAYSPAGGSTGAKLSGPGTLAQISGGRWQISGLSTSQPTQIQITWTNNTAQTLQPEIYASQQHLTGDAMTVAGVSFTIT